MTSPVPPTAPGVVAAPNDMITARLQALEARVSELSRRDLSNAQVGQGGRLRAMYSNGVEALQVGKDPVDGVNKTRISYSSGITAFAIGPGAATYGSQETAVIKDLAGNVVFAMDELAGYGISHPALAYAVGVTFQGTTAATLTAGTEYAVVRGATMYYHPAMRVQGLVNTSDTNWSYRVRVLNADGTEAVSSSWTTGLNGPQYYDKILLLPQTAVGQQNTSIEVRLKLGATGSVDTFPMPPVGVTKSLYDLLPSIH